MNEIIISTELNVVLPLMRRDILSKDEVIESSGNVFQVVKIIFYEFERIDNGLYSRPTN